jgi:hypothetical protein
MHILTRQHGFNSLGRLSKLVRALGSEGTGATLAAPVGIVPGSFILFTDLSFNTSGGPPASVTPSGFISLRSDTIGNLRSSWSYRLSDGSEGGATLTGQDGSDSDFKACHVFRSIGRPITGITISSNVGSGLSNANPAAQTILSGALAGPVFVVAGYTANASTSSATFTQGGSEAREGDYDPATGSRHHIAWKTFRPGETGVDIVADIGDLGDNNAVMGIAASLAF